MLGRKENRADRPGGGDWGSLMKGVREHLSEVVDLRPTLNNNELPYDDTGQKVTRCVASSERKMEASEGRAGVTMQGEQQVRWPRGQSIPLTFLAPQNTDRASRTPLPFHAGVPHPIPCHPHLSCLVGRVPAPLGAISPIVVGSSSRSESSNCRMSYNWHRTPRSQALGQPSETGCLYVQKILAGLPDTAAVDQ